MNYLTKLNPWKTALFISFFEFFTMSILPYFSFGYVIDGFFVGFIGGVFAIFVFNLISKFGFTLNIELDKSKNHLKKLDILVPSIANGIFLSLLFIVMEEIDFAFRNEIINDALKGFSATFIAMIGCIAIYNIIIRFTKVRLGGIIDSRSFRIGRINLTRSCFFVALFELFILPLMGLTFILLGNLPYQLTSPLVGLFGGFFGSLIASFSYNFLARFFKGIGFELE